MKRLAIIVLLLAGCAHAPPPPPPTFNSVPRVVLDAFCNAVRAEGLASDSSIAVVRTSRKLVTPLTIAALAEVSFQAAGDTASIVEGINRSIVTVPVEIPTENCEWEPVDFGKAKSDMMVVEFSTPFGNPYDKSEAGSLARLSVGGQGATWYWIRLVRRGDHWISLGVLPVGAHG